MTDSLPRRPRIVIVGAGFGGMHAAWALKKAPADVLMLDKRNFTLFQPLLYQVATATLAAADIATPIRTEVADQPNTEVFATAARDVDLENQQVITDHGLIRYDYLIVATGVKHSYFGNDNWAEFAPGLKTVEHALEVRRRIFRAFELAEIETDPERQRALLTFVIVGAGPTGVELAGTLAELANGTLRHDFRNFDPRSARIILAEGADDVLPSWPEKLRGKAHRSLERLGVEVRTGTLVTHIDAEQVVIKTGDDEQTLPCRTVLWAAGVKRSQFGDALAKRSASTCVRGRFKVTDELCLPSYPNIFVIGDLAHFEQDDAALPGVAPVAKQMGTYVGKEIRRRLEDKPKQKFHYTDTGSLAVIGVNRAVARLPGMEFSGFFAWFIWAFIHIAFLIRASQRFSVMSRWFLKYFFRRRGIRLITGRLTDGQGDGVTKLDME